MHTPRIETNCQFCGYSLPLQFKQTIDERVPLESKKAVTASLITKKQIRNISLFPSDRTIMCVIIGTIVLLLLPLSPFFIDNILPSHDIDGPHIFRNFSTIEAENALLHIEELDLTQITGYGTRGWRAPHLMDGITLDYFLDEISQVQSTISGSPKSISFTWNMTIVETIESELNLDVFLEYLTHTKTISSSYDIDTSYLTWWENNDQLHTEYTWDLTNSTFIEFTAPIKWVCYGYYNYYYSGGILSGGAVEETSQLIFLDDSLNLVCLAHKYDYVSFDP
ncbi:MAG: hypothetical protein FK733_06955 [Asgard group archaeon]|nr:hypothetical protein [Asgard group archaeon]